MLNSCLDFPVRPIDIHRRFAVPDTRALLRLRPAVLAFLLLVAIPLTASAQPFSWSIPSGVETWSTDHVHTVLWSGGPAAPVNIYLVALPANVVVQAVTISASNDGEAVFRLSDTLVPGTYQLYIEDNIPTTWTYGPEFQIRASEPCISPCTQGATGSPALVCGQTQAQAESLAIALVQSQIACGMAGTVDLNSIQIETTLLAVGAFNCPSGYTGAYAVEASGIWCCCHEPLPVTPVSWSDVKLLNRYRGE